MGNSTEMVLSVEEQKVILSSTRGVKLTLAKEEMDNLTEREQKELRDKLFTLGLT